MCSRMVWVVASGTAFSVLAACSGDNAGEPTTTGFPSQPGVGGSSSTGMGPGQSPPAPAGTGGSASEVSNVPQRVAGDDGAAAGSNDADAGAGDAGAGEPASVDAGGTLSVRDAGGTPPGNAVGFSDVFQLLVTNCGACHGNSNGNLPAFAQARNEAASFAVTQTMALPPNTGRISGRIVARAVTARTMPPDCRGGAPGTGTCLDATEAALLQAWVTQGAQP